MEISSVALALCTFIKSENWPFHIQNVLNVQPRS